MTAIYETRSILDQLDEHAAACTFPMLDNGYVYLVDTRLTAWRDDRRWAMTIEVLGYSPRAGQLDNAIHRYGNCIDGPTGARNSDFVCLLGDGVEDADNGEFALPGLMSVTIRGQSVPLRPHKDPWPLPDLFRSLVPDHRGALLANDRELRAHVPNDLGIFLRLNQWHHPDCVNNEMPSQSEAFRLIAEAIRSGDPSAYMPTEEPNTHWSNWPDGGSL